MALNRLSLSKGKNGFFITSTFPRVLSEKKLIVSEATSFVSFLIDFMVPNLMLHLNDSIGYLKYVFWPSYPEADLLGTKYVQVAINRHNNIHVKNL
jgi:hypothetical protein